jgi:nitrous oxidase accessory protein NosD
VYMNNQPREKLRELIAEYGLTLIDDPRRCRALLKDYCGQHKREIHLLISALQQGVAAELLSSPKDLPYCLPATRLAQRLHNQLGVTPEFAAWAVESWALALGMAVEPVVVAPPTVSIAPDAPVLITLVVSANGAGDYRTIGQALSNAQPGARIQIEPGVYRESLVIDKPLELVGHGESAKIIIESADYGCLQIDADQALIKGLTLYCRPTDLNDSGHFAVDIERGHVILEDCDIRSDSMACIAIHGAAARPVIRHCRIHHSRENGVFVYDYARGLIEDCDIFANTLAGIAIEQGSNPIFRRCQIHDGQETGVYVWEQGQGLIEDCDIFANALAGVAIEQGSNPTLRHCQIHDSQESGIYIWDRGRGLVEDCDIFANAMAGITITQHSYPNIRHCRIHDGRESGVEVWEQGEGLLEDCDIFANATTGVLIHSAGHPLIRGCRINHNHRYAIRIEEEGLGTVEHCDLTHNAFGAWSIASGCRLKSVDNKEKDCESADCD